MEQEFKIFRTKQSNLLPYDGQLCEVLRPLSAEEADLTETGPMFRIAFGPGQNSFQCDAFANELHDEN